MGGYFFFMLRAVRRIPITLMITREKLKRLSYVTYCTASPPFGGEE